MIPALWLLYYYMNYSNNIIISIGNHTHSRSVIVLAIVKIGRGEIESNYSDCVYNCSVDGRKCV